MIVNKTELTQIIQYFVEGLLKKAKVKHAGNCLVMSQILQSYLETFFGLKTVIINVSVWKRGKKINHYCLQLKDKTIIDATASQFKNMPMVYIGKLPEKYTLLTP